jgi:hypothetical protein
VRFPKTSATFAPEFVQAASAIAVSGVSATHPVNVSTQTSNTLSAQHSGIEAAKYRGRGYCSIALNRF